MNHQLNRTHFLTPDTRVLNSLRQGDIVLFECLDTNSHIVSKIQKHVGYVLPEVNIVHAAIYIDHGTLCQALPTLWLRRPQGGIVIQLAWSEIAKNNRKIHVLRDMQIDDATRKDIALYAASKCHKDSTYDWVGVFDGVYHYLSEKLREKISERRFLQNFLKVLPGDVKSHKKTKTKQTGDLGKLHQVSADNDPLGVNAEFGGAIGFVCSDLVTHCYNFILGTKSPFSDLQKLKLPLYSPADIYLNQRLVSVSVSSLNNIYEINEVAS
ncbi:hypothetical protein [Agrobacterium rosae]|uniref:hypothetical protein n=1 Tax=Agrobacterium rosae TaxID=1972867 RepID=UPI0011AEEF59|nr:hypothetical protein [Agrobacterium rosae]